MQPLFTAADSEFGSVRFVLTDMDETLTYQGRLAAATYAALERLQAYGIHVIPVTAAPAGWCDQMARMWPVDGVIGENGGLFFQRAVGGHELRRHFWHSETEQGRISSRLQAIARQVQARVPEAILASDQPFRLTSLAFSLPEHSETRQAIVEALEEAGADVTVNNLWVLGWLGGYDKLSMSRRILAEVYDLDINENRNAVLYSGDSTNDAPMFDFFRHTVGVSSVRKYLSQLSTPPAWITQGPGGVGFVEVVDKLLASRHQPV
ncbi:MULTISPECIES: HAD-IIB family hydrolase [Pseudomonas]|uniref:HAD family hydrolase n=1 Tax=Pseudomonas brassicacearum TaxID=930166 RepID=A0A423JTB3_9PSED|nr:MULTISPECIES: HAD-IIB family hydrolase [Pseudomonas]RON40951.1 HAD family hydrolase [Pseudomonas brassicacearum]